MPLLAAISARLGARTQLLVGLVGRGAAGGALVRYRVEAGDDALNDGEHAGVHDRRGVGDAAHAHLGGGSPARISCVSVVS